MKLFASILLTLAFATIAAAQTKIIAFSVTDVQKTSDNVYSATASTVKQYGKSVPVPSNGSALTVTTEGCTHIPAKGGENGIVAVNGYEAAELLFSSGATCAVVKISIN